MRIISVLLTTLMISVNANAFQQDKNIVVYSNAAYVIQQHSFKEANGIQEFIVTNLPSSIIPESIFIEKTGGSYEILKQEFDRDVFSYSRFLSNQTGKNILLTLSGNETVSGTLLNAGSGEIVIKNNDVITAISRNQVKSFSIEGISEDPVFKPSLRIHVNMDRSEELRFNLHYLVNGLEWSAEYTGHYDQKSKEISLQSWVRVNNSTGQDIVADNFSLIAGEVNLSVGSGRSVRGFAPEMKTAMAADMSVEFDRQDSFIYHRYRLNQRLNLPDSREQRLRLFESAVIDVDEEFIFDQSRFGDKIAALLKFRNDDKSGFGQPIPAGTIRIYQGQNDNAVFLGGDRITNIPVGNDARVNIGTAFDLTAERVLEEYLRYDNRRRDETYRFTLKNASKEQRTIKIIEHYGGQWDIVNSSLEFKRIDASTVTFEIGVPAGGEAELTYTVRYN